jgi:hypothetical protein
MTLRKKEGSQRPPESKAEDRPLTFSNPHIMQQTAAHAAWAHRAQSNAHIADVMGSTLGGSRTAWLEYQVPASETKEGKERLQAYYEALGRFVQIFAEVEKLVWQTLVHYVGTSHEVAKIVLTAGKVDQCAKYIKQVAAAVNVPKEKRDDLELVLQQLGILNGVRDSILHYGATAIAEGRGTVSNAWKAKAEPTEFPISDTALAEMADDARQIIAHLAYRHLGRPWPRAASNIAFLEEVLQRPWQYKYPSQLNSQTKKAETQQARKRGPKPPHRPQS